jgi:hypothetical protein
VGAGQITEVEGLALWGLGEVEAGSGDDAVEEAGPVLHALEVAFDDDGELVDDAYREVAQPATVAAVAVREACPEGLLLPQAWLDRA